MVFFSKLRDRLFRSSSKLDEGLEAIVGEGGTPELPPPDLPAPGPRPDPAPPELPEPAPEPPGIPAEPDPVPAPDDPVPGPAPIELPDPGPPTEAPQPVDPDPRPEGEKRGLLGRLFGRTEATTVVRRTLDDGMLESLEELLIASDMGVDTALRITANLAEGADGPQTLGRRDQTASAHRAQTR